MAKPKAQAAFTSPMLLLSSTKLPEGDDWQYELKLDGYRGIAIKTGGTVQLRSRNNKEFNDRYPAIAKALAGLPNETVVDGEIVAMDENGRPSFNALQNGSSSGIPLLFYLFDVIMLSGLDLRNQPLSARRHLLETKVLPKLDEPIRYSPQLTGPLGELIDSVKKSGLEGLVAKNLNSPYEPGLRSGAWLKMRVNKGQEFVIAGYTEATRGFDALLLGYYENGKLLYASRTRNGFTPALRNRLFARMEPLRIEECPFANLPEPRGGRWGQGLTAAKMKDCRWLKPELVGQFEFVEWTADNHLRHTRFVALRIDKSAQGVSREP